MRKLARRFAQGDTDAGAPLAAAMLRAQSLLHAVSELTPALQDALAARTVSESLKSEISAALAEGITAEDIAGEISTYEIASEIDTNDIANEIDTDDVAQHLAGNVDACDIAEHVEVCYDSLAESVVSRVVDYLDMDELATLVAAKLAETVETAVEEALAERE